MAAARDAAARLRLRRRLSIVMALAWHDAASSLQRQQATLPSYGNRFPAKTSSAGIFLFLTCYVAKMLRGNRRPPLASSPGRDDMRMCVCEAKAAKVIVARRREERREGQQWCMANISWRREILNIVGSGGE